MNRIDMTNQKFGMLTAIKCVGYKPYGSALWQWQCDCGKRKVISGYDVRRGHTTSCGCMWQKITGMKLTKDITGKKFGKLTVISRSHQRPDGKKLYWYWKAKCECGTIKTYRTNALTTGNTKSCGCTNKKVTKRMAARMVRLYAAGNSADAIAKILNIHGNTVLKILHARGVKIRKP